MNSNTCMVISGDSNVSPPCQESGTTISFVRQSPVPGGHKFSLSVLYRAFTSAKGTILSFSPPISRKGGVTGVT